MQKGRNKGHCYILNVPLLYKLQGSYEPRHEKNGVLHLRKQSRRGHSAADQHLCFRYKDSTIPLLPIIKHLTIFCGCIARFARTWSETRKTGFLATRRKFTCTRIIPVAFLGTFYTECIK